MKQNYIQDIGLWFLELYDIVDYKARSENGFYKELGEKFRSYSRTITESVAESPHDTLLFILSKASLKCVKGIIEVIGSINVLSWEPQRFLEEIIYIKGCDSEKLVYAILFLASLNLYSLIEGVDADLNNLFLLIKDLLSSAASIQSPYQELLESLYSYVKRAAEIVFSESYD